jgi:hypothetical protein
MGANAVTTVPVYTAGEVLTAADMNITNSGIPVFATTVTRDAAFGGTGEKTLAEGQFAYIEATNTTQYYDGAAWQSVGVSPGLVLVKTQTIGTTVASVTVTDAFSSTYDNYLIVVSGGVGSTTSQMALTLGATATGYYRFGTYGTYSSATVQGIQNSNGTNWGDAVGMSTNSLSGTIELIAPNLAKRTSYSSSMQQVATAGYSLRSAGFLDDATQYTAFTLTCGTGTVTGGTIKVYGYANS